MPLAAINCASVDGQHSINNYSESFPVIEDQACEERSGSFPDDGITSWQTRRTHQRGKSYNHRSILTRPAFSFDRISSQLFGADGVFRRWHEKGRWEGFVDGCPTRRVVKKEPLRDDCLIRSKGFGQNKISRGPCQKVKIRSSKNIEINPDNWNAKKFGIFPRSPTLAEKDVDQPFSNCCSCPLAALSNWQISEMYIFNILQLCGRQYIFFHNCTALKISRSPILCCSSNADSLDCETARQENPVVSIFLVLAFFMWLLGVLWNQPSEQRPQFCTLKGGLMPTTYMSNWAFCVIGPRLILCQTKWPKSLKT